MHQLKALNCEFGQGYFFSKPLDSKRAEALIAVKLPQYIAIWVLLLVTCLAPPDTFKAEIPQRDTMIKPAL